jgi:photosystem II stability/assembly factor-like uncharacterized protein
VTRARLISLLAASVALPAAAQNVPIRGDDPAGAARYFVEIRVGPNGAIPSGARATALAQMRARWPQLVARRDATFLTVPALDPARTWTPIGPRPITGFLLPTSGRLTSIAVHPTDPNIIYVGGAQGGVWKTVDAGANWVPLTDGQCSLAMGSVALDPVNPEIVYVGTGEQNFSGDSYYGCGVLKSVNGGQSWAEVGRTVITGNGARRPRISRVVVDKFTANSANTLVMAATDAGLFRSLDAGVTWSQTTGPGGAVTDLVADPSTQGVFYAANGDLGGFSPSGTSNGVYKTTDGGTTWTKTTMPSANAGRISLALAPSAPGTVYAAVHATSTSANGNALLGIWQTTDGGTTWAQKHGADQTLCSQQCWYDMVIAVDPADPATLYFGGFSLHKSVDSGVSFVNIGGAIHVDHHSFAFDPVSPATIYAGSDGGIFKSIDRGTNWTSLNTNLELTQFYSGISVSPTSATVILGGTQDNGTLQWAGAGGWPLVLGSDGGFTALDQLTGGTAFAETQWTANSGFSGPRRRDADAGASQFVLKMNGINAGDRALFIPPIVMDPLHPRIVFFGTQHLYRSSNSGDQWGLFGPNLGGNFGSVSSIGVAPSDTMTVYVGASDGHLSYTHDLGLTWTVPASLGVGPITDIAVDPRDARTAIIVQSNFTSAGKVFRTTDGGVTWTNLTFNLPNIPVMAVVLEPGSRDITIGTDLGVFTLPNGAASWTPVVNGLPNIAVYDLVYDAPRSRLVAATHGRGMFALDVTMTGLRGDVAGPNNAPPDGLVGALDAQVILAMAVGNTPPAGALRYPNGDANCDGQVTALDAMIVLRKAAGLTDPGLCVGTVK